MTEIIVTVLLINISYFVVPGAFCVNVLRVYEGCRNRAKTNGDQITLGYPCPWRAVIVIPKVPLKPHIDLHFTARFKLFFFPKLTEKDIAPRELL